MLRAGEIMPTSGITWRPADPDRRRQEPPPRRRRRPVRRRPDDDTPDVSDAVAYLPDGRTRPALPARHHLDITV
ncbi:MAG: hypothetical protein KatS3mg042_1106 [Rhodothermaceae bacterium]|nr:MAG: hypothetical protein KatS3mg042_1106 [Rhodothermaceae bacterium]